MRNQAEWYLLHRIEFLQNRLDKLRRGLSKEPSKVDFEDLREFLETRGRVKELENILEHLSDWQ
ncbi:hypothetical protein [Alicyclobacillus dauci]|uniref:Fur-regulated basic protein A n=1 Tax=Alicyclobacillus dauci TaxID=1475485 RepID=A0ABY6Z7L7_9BACL|nr:hypothetical protein [Alicyclobacillus dauci]WAH38683.1 hypothetical protein NZD86_09465 [Alicyclobacillus dauci]